MSFSGPSDRQPQLLQLPLGELSIPVSLQHPAPPAAQLFALLPGSPATQPGTAVVATWPMQHTDARNLYLKKKKYLRYICSRSTCCNHLLSLSPLCIFTALSFMSFGLCGKVISCVIRVFGPFPRRDFSVPRKRIRAEPQSGLEGERSFATVVKMSSFLKCLTNLMCVFCIRRVRYDMHRLLTGTRNRGFLGGFVSFTPPPPHS